MNDKQVVFNEIALLHAQGRLAEAHNLAQDAGKAVPGDPDFVSILNLVRMEFLTNRQNDTLNQIALQMKRNGQTLSQLLVRDILSDTKFDDPLRLERFGYSTASQNEEDGMLTEVFRRIGVKHRTFFEFGVGNGLQNNTLHFLLQGWKGWWIEINQPKVHFMRKNFASAIQSGQLVLDDTPVDAENINAICEKLAIPEYIDLLSIDIDGNDYHVFKAMDRIDARVIVLEYNPIYPPPMKMVGAYDRQYAYDENTYIGASFESLTELAEDKGYVLVGCSIGGVNAIYVKKELAEGKFQLPATASNFYHPPRYQLSFTGGFGAGGKANFGPLASDEV